MTEKAIEKINAEMQKDANNKYLEIIGQYIIDRCNEKSTAEKVMKKELTLSGAFAEISKQAKSKAKNGCAVLKDSEIFDVVDKYFGFSNDENIRQQSVAFVDGETSAKKASVIQGLDIDFESLI